MNSSNIKVHVIESRHMQVHEAMAILPPYGPWDEVSKSISMLLNTAQVAHPNVDTFLGMTGVYGTQGTFWFGDFSGVLLPVRVFVSWES